PRASKLSDSLIAGANLATAYSQALDWGHALSIIDRCERLAPGQATPRIMKGKALHAMGCRSEAVPFLADGVKAAPGSAELQYLLGTAYQSRARADDLDRAYACFLKAIELDHNHAASWYELARIEERLGHFLRASTAYQNAYTLGVEGPRPLL